MSTKYHMAVDIQGLLDHYGRKSLDGIVIGDDGKRMNDRQARNYLYRCLSEGKKVLPSTDCDGFDFVKGCPGHKIEEQ
jgi:hypothetical protein